MTTTVRTGLRSKYNSLSDGNVRCVATIKQEQKKRKHNQICVTAKSLGSSLSSLPHSESRVSAPKRGAPIARVYTVVDGEIDRLRMQIASISFVEAIVYRTERTNVVVVERDRC